MDSVQRQRHETVHCIWARRIYGARRGVNKKGHSLEVGRQKVEDVLKVSIYLVSPVKSTRVSREGTGMNSLGFMKFPSAGDERG